jgi:hypothetical protein
MLSTALVIAEVSGTLNFIRINTEVQVGNIVLSSLSAYPNPPLPWSQLSSLKRRDLHDDGGSEVPIRYLQVSSLITGDSQWLAG